MRRAAPFQCRCGNEPGVPEGSGSGWWGLQLAARAAAPQEEEAPWDDDETPTSPAAASPAAPPAAATLGGVTGGGNGDTAAEQRHTERAPRAPAALTSVDESQPAHERSSPPGD